MTDKKRKRGRPKLSTPITEDYAPSRRQAVNAMYMYEAVDLITEAATDIPNADLLWFADEQTRTATSKNGVLEQIGRMLIQDGFSVSDCIYIAGLAADAVNAGYTAREVEKAIRALRLTHKALAKHRDEPYYENAAYHAAEILREMAGERSSNN
ncbi:MAG: hypothetical protein ACOX17_07240 [Christensenellales bacterium]